MATREEQFKELMVERTKIIKEYTEKLFAQIEPGLNGIYDYLNKNEEIGEGEELIWDQVMTVKDDMVCLLGAVCNIDTKEFIVPVRVTLPREMILGDDAKAIVVYLEEQDAKLSTNLTEQLNNVFGKLTKFTDEDKEEYRKKLN